MPYSSISCGVESRAYSDTWLTVGTPIQAELPALESLYLLTIYIAVNIPNPPYLLRFFSAYLSTSHSQTYIYWLSKTTPFIPFHSFLPSLHPLSDLGPFLNFPGIALGTYIIKDTPTFLGLSSIWDSIFSQIRLLVLPQHPILCQNLQIVLTWSNLVRFSKFLIPQIPLTSHILFHCSHANAYITSFLGHLFLSESSNSYNLVRFCPI